MRSILSLQSLKLEKTLYLSKLDTKIAICCYESLGKNLGKSDNLIFDSKNLKKGNNKTSKFFVSNIIQQNFSFSSGMFSSVSEGCEK